MEIDAQTRKRSAGLGSPKPVFEVLAPLHSCHMTVHDAGQTVLHAATVDADEFRRHHSGEWFGYSLDFLSELDQRPVDYVVELCDEAGRRLAEIECSLDA